MMTNPDIRRTKVLIVGSGPAGYTAAIYAARANLAPIVIEGFQPGGQLTITTDVENYSGFADPIQGPWLMAEMRAQAENSGAELIGDMAIEIDTTCTPFVCKTEGDERFEADTIIISTGAQAKWLGVKGEEAFSGLGVSACATCDGFFFKNKHVIVVGGGNTAVEEAIYLSNMCKSVTLVHRRGELRAEQILQDRMNQTPNITTIWHSTVEEILGNEQGVTAVQLRDVVTGQLSTLKIDAVFVAIGHHPNTGIFAGQIQTDNEGYITTKSGTSLTNIPGIFAAGDVQDKTYRQAITAAGSGCMAALDAQRYLVENPLNIGKS